MIDKTTAIVAGLVIVVLAGVVTALAWHGTVDGQAAMTYLSSLTLAGVVGGATHVAARTSARATQDAYAAQAASRAPIVATARRAPRVGRKRTTRTP